LIDLLQKLTAHPKIWPAIISGRRLAHIEKLVPIPGIWRAGSYGIELRVPNGEKVERISFKQIRPTLEQLKPVWEALIDGREGFYLEDKGWSLAIHAKFADDISAKQVLRSAREKGMLSFRGSTFNILGGYKFLEIAPSAANKANTVAFIIEQLPEKNLLPIYLGDDDKDEQAFPVVRDRGGLVGYVGNQSQTPQADFRLKSPADTRNWLWQLLHLFVE
jgi:trehalose-phosphatase